MTDQLKELANECKERGIDFDDVSPNQGSTSCDKLVRHYIAAASPDDVLALIAEVERLKSQEPVAYVVSIGNSPISITCPVKHLDLLAKSHNAPLYLASGAAPTRPTTPEQQADPKYIVQSNGRHSPLLTHMMTKRTTPAQAEPPPEWESIKNILAEYGLDAIAFVGEWKAAQRQWQGLTDEDWNWIADKKGTSLDTFDQGVAWAQARLKEKNT